MNLSALNSGLAPSATPVSTEANNLGGALSRPSSGSQSGEDFAAFSSTRAPVMLGAGPLLNGFMLAGERIAIVTETELYAGTARTRATRERLR